MPDLRSRNVMTGRFRTHYTECGNNGPALVLCHGGGPGSSGEAGFGQLMPSLATKFQVYALDSVGGFGENVAPEFRQFVKEQDTVTAPIDRPILVLRISVRPR